MFSFKRKDILDERKSELIFTDLSQSLITTKEDLDKSLSKIPNLKLKSDPIEQKFIKTSENSIKINVLTKISEPNKINSNIASNLSSESSKVLFLNPIPEPMDRLDLNDFSGTDIDWKMLTLLRPKSSSDEQFFSKMVELYQLRHKTRTEDGFAVREAAFRVSRHPRVMRYKPMSFSRIDSFGFETNHSFNKIKEDITYEAFERVPIETRNESVVDPFDGDIDEILSLADNLDFKLFEK